MASIPERGLGTDAVALKGFSAISAIREGRGFPTVLRLPPPGIAAFVEVGDAERLRQTAWDTLDPGVDRLEEILAKR